MKCVPLSKFVLTSVICIEKALIQVNTNTEIVCIISRNRINRVHVNEILLDVVVVVYL